MSDTELCPIHTCDWTHDSPAPEPPRDALAGLFGPGTLTAVSAYQRAHRTEVAIERHLTTHTVQEWARTMSVERQKASAWFAAVLAALGDDFSPQRARDASEEALRWFNDVMYGTEENAS